MTNMAYCRFENTYQDLQDCVDNWDNELSESEEKFKQYIFDLAQEICEKEWLL